MAELDPYMQHGTQHELPATAPEPEASSRLQWLRGRIGTAVLAGAIAFSSLTGGASRGEEDAPARYSTSVELVSYEAAEPEEPAPRLDLSAPELQPDTAPEPVPEPASAPPAPLEPGIEVTPLNVFGGRTIKPTAIVEHWWGSDNGGNPDIRSLVDTLRSRKLSVQYGVTADGRAYQLTEQPDTYARHAKCANGYAIGIEIQGPPINPAQIDAAAKLTHELMEKYDIPLEERWDPKRRVMTGVTSHKNIDPHCRGANGKVDVSDDYMAQIRDRIRQLQSPPPAPAPQPAPPEEKAEEPEASGTDIRLALQLDAPEFADKPAAQPEPAPKEPSAPAEAQPPQPEAPEAPAEPEEAEEREVPSLALENTPELAAQQTRQPDVPALAALDMSNIPELGIVPPAPAEPAAPEASPAPASSLESIPPESRSVLERSLDDFERLRPIYEQVAEAEGIPWQMLAAVHWREGGSALRTDRSTLAGERLGTRNPDHPDIVINTFEEGLHASAQFLKDLALSKYGITIRPEGNTQEELVRIFVAYNRGGIYNNRGIAPELSPYAMNGHDPEHMRMPWPKGDPVDGRDGNPLGALTVYKGLGGPVS